MVNTALLAERGEDLPKDVTNDVSKGLGQEVGQGLVGEKMVGSDPNTGSPSTPQVLLTVRSEAAENNTDASKKTIGNVFKMIEMTL